MRIRTIKPDFFKHDAIAELPPLSRLFFIGLWCVADRDGRLEDRPARLKIEILPYDNADADKILTELAKRGFIQRYTADGLQVIQVVAFKRHQRITGKEAEIPSRFPEYNEETMGKQRGNTGEASGRTGKEGKGREGNEEGKGKDSAPSSPPVQDPIQDEPKPPKPQNFEHAAFIQGWTLNFKDHWGFDYTFEGGRDGKAVKELLRMGILRIDLLEIAKAAWRRAARPPKAFNCEQAATISGFRNYFNQIRAEISNDGSKPSPTPPTPKTKEQLDREMLLEAMR